MSSWDDWVAQLQQASFRGVPFAVLGSEARYGRRQAVHEYPYRDKPWAEDLGRSTQPLVIQGFLITDSAVYGGGDVIDQRAQLVTACITKGSGPLVHPTLGSLDVSVLDGGLVVVEKFDHARYFEISISCVESGDNEFPSDADSTGDGTDAAADDADQASSDDFASDVSDDIEDGSSILDMAVNTAQSWISGVLIGATDATSLFNMLVDLPGQFGRFFAGATQGFNSAAPPASSATINSLILQGTAERATIQTACDGLLAACANTDPVAMATAAQAVTSALLSSTANPADAIRIFTNVANFYPNVVTAPSVSGMAEAEMQTALSAVLRRASLTALARASALYQPSSADDAAALRSQLADLFQAEIDIAGDAPDDASFDALCSMRAAVILDLNTRGGALPELQTVKTAETLPACVLAQILYQDGTRTDELISEADPVHPAFMPVNFKALAS